MTDRLTPEQRHKNMQHIKSKDTNLEIKLRRALWEAGYRYRKNYRSLPGKPDIVFTKYKIAVFCDSEFFHGKDWDKLQEQLRKGHNAEFWIEKISKNIARDQRVNDELSALGWTVIRFWGTEIKKNVDGCVNIIGKTILEKILINN